jgi:hypothetical protein
LRTVLWGWIGQGISEEQVADLRTFQSQVGGSELEELLDESEIEALNHRIEDLIAKPVMPSPSPHWPAVPWPVF